jgi:hypothetical protein
MEKVNIIAIILKGFLEHNRDKQHEVYKMNRETDEVIKKTKDDKLIWESQRMELS